MEPTALLAPIPRIGPWIDPWRDRHDPSAAVGMPPHVTVLAPFRTPDRLTRQDLQRLRDVMAVHPPIETTLATVGMFDDDVLHLRLDPEDRVRELTAAVHQEFPDTPPYRGRYADVVPHVTVGHQIPRASARHAARSLMLALPVHVRIDVVQLWVRADDTWAVATSFPLGTQVVAATA